MAIEMEATSSPLLSPHQIHIKQDATDFELATLDHEDPKTHNVKPYTKSVALAMTLNYIIGTGCFGLPYAFMEAGIVLTTCFLVFGSVLATLAMNYTLEIMSRAEGVSSVDGNHDRIPHHKLTYRKFDFSTIGEIFGGKNGKNMVQLTILAYCVGTLWSYASVFASSIASLVYSYILTDNTECNVFSNPSTRCLNAYYISMCVYAVIVITLVLMNLGEQAKIQKILSMYRVIAITVMLITLITKLSQESGDVISARLSKIGAFNFSNFGKGFGPTILAINFHYNIPDALQPLQTKQHARLVCFLALVFSAVMYLFIGILGAIAFDEVKPLVTLNWTSFTGCSGGWVDCDTSTPDLQSNGWGIFVQLLVLMFPVVNVASAYPMVGVTMGDNLYMSIPKSLTTRWGVDRLRQVSRLLCVIPPLILATAFKRLDLILSISGLFGFLLGLTIPAWLQANSVKYCQAKWKAPINVWKCSISLGYLSQANVARSIQYFSYLITIIAAVSLFL